MTLRLYQAGLQVVVENKTSKYNLYQTGLQVVVENKTSKYNLYQTGLQVVLRQKSPVYDFYQAGLQTVLRRLDMPQHVQYSIYELPVEVVYEPAPETIQFSHCLEPGYFFAVDHNARMVDGETLSLKVYGGVPPYTWSLDVGSSLTLSATSTDEPEVTLSITGVFEAGVEEITVEDSCGSQATICIYLCLDYTTSSYTCTTEFTCSEHCRRAVVPIEPPIPPPPVPPPIPPSPPEPPLAPHETEILTAVLGQNLTGLELLVVSFYNEPDNTEVRLLWDLNTMAPLASSTGPAFVTKAEYDSRYSYLGEPEWLNDLLVVGGSAALNTINKQNYDGNGALTIEDFGYPVDWEYGSGCGYPVDLATWVPIWFEDSETIDFGVGGGVNYSEDNYDAGFIMPPWDDAEVIVQGRGQNSNSCSDRQLHVWPSAGGPDWATWYEFSFFGIQAYDALLYFNIAKFTCVPWTYAHIQDSDVDIYHTIANIGFTAVDMALGANENHGYARGFTSTDPGDWGSFSLVPGSDPEFDPDPSFIRTSMQYAGVFFQEGDETLLWTSSAGCVNLDKGVLGGSGSWVPTHEELMYEYFTHFARIGVYYPYRGMDRGENTGHRKIKIVANEDLQCQIFLFQRTETLDYIQDATERKRTFHAALETGELKGYPPQKLPRRGAFEKALDQLFDLYYTENDYDSGSYGGSKIDPSLEIRVGVVSFSSQLHLYELPVEVVYERS